MNATAKLRMPVLTNADKVAANMRCTACGAVAVALTEEAANGAFFGTCAEHGPVRLRPAAEFTTSGLQDKLFEIMDTEYAAVLIAGKAPRTAKTAAVKAGTAAIDETDADAVAVSKGMIAFWKNNH